MFKINGQRLVPNIQIEQEPQIEKAEPPVEIPSTPAPQPAHLTSTKEPQNKSLLAAELQFSSFANQLFLNQIVDRYATPPKKLSELPLEKAGVPEYQIDSSYFKPIAREIFTGSGNDTVDIDMGTDEMVHVRVNGNEVWTGSLDQFKKLKIDTGNGDDVVNNTVDAATIFTGSGDDRVYNGASNTWIVTGDGNDRVVSRGGYNAIQTGRGQDNVHSYGENNIIYTGTGDDYVASNGDLNQISTEDGADIVQSTGEENRVGTGLGDDSIEIFGNENRIGGGFNDDKVKVKGDRNVIYQDKPGDGEDSIEEDGNDNEIKVPGNRN